MVGSCKFPFWDMIIVRILYLKNVYLNLFQKGILRVLNADQKSVYNIPITEGFKVPMRLWLRLEYPKYRHNFLRIPPVVVAKIWKHQRCSSFTTQLITVHCKSTSKTNEINQNIFKQSFTSKLKFLFSVKVDLGRTKVC